MAVITAEESAQKAARNRVEPALTWDEAAAMEGGVMGVIRANIQHSKEHNHLTKRRESSYAKLQGLGGCSHEHDLFEPRGFASAIVWCYGNNLRTCITFLETLTPLQRLQLTHEDLQDTTSQGFTQSTAKTLLSKIERVKCDYARWLELHPGQFAYGEDEDDDDMPAMPTQPFLHAITLDAEPDADEEVEAVEADVGAPIQPGPDAQAAPTALSSQPDVERPSSPLQQTEAEPNVIAAVKDSAPQTLTAKLNEDAVQSLSSSHLPLAAVSVSSIVPATIRGYRFL